MDIDVSLDEWGSDIDSACDILMSSECSLVGGFYHVTSQHGNIWGDIDGHLGIGDQDFEDVLVDRVPEPYKAARISPREKSVARYMQMDLSKIARPESRGMGRPQPVTEIQTPGIVKQALMKPADKVTPTKTIPRPKSSGDTKTEKKPKFFRLGEYPGSRPVTADSRLPKTNPVRQKLPYFREIQLQDRSNMAAINARGRISPKIISQKDGCAEIIHSLVGITQAVDCQTISNLGILSSKYENEDGSLDENKALERKSFLAVEAIRSTLEKTDSEKTEIVQRVTGSDKANPDCKIENGPYSMQLDSTKANKGQKVTTIRVMPKSELNDNSTSKNDQSRLIMIVSKPRNRLRNAFKRLRKGMSSLFSRCVSCGP